MSKLLRSNADKQDRTPDRNVQYLKRADAYDPMIPNSLRSSATTVTTQIVKIHLLPRRRFASFRRGGGSFVVVVTHGLVLETLSSYCCRAASTSVLRPFQFIAAAVNT